MELAVQVDGLRRVGLETLRAPTATSANAVRADLPKIIRQLKITPQAEEALKTFFWGRTTDVYFTFSAPFLDAKLIVTKLMGNPTTRVEQTKANIHGKTPFSINYAIGHRPRPPGLSMLGVTLH